jgi:16S rRNA methyltransferase GidB
VSSDTLSAGLSALGQPSALAQRLLAYRDLLQRWNRVYNLSAVRNPEAMVTRHLLDSLSVLPWLADGDLLDVGTGPGLPGIPIALAQPSRPVTLVESNGKKVRFLRQVCLEMQLDNVAVVPNRIEEYNPMTRFNGVICRAFTEAFAFWQGTARLLSTSGIAIAMKGRLKPAELAALDQAGVNYRSQPLAVPGLDAERHLLIMMGSRPATG